MTTIEGLRYMHNQAKRLINSDTHPWFVKHIDALFAEIDRLTSENAALTRQAMRADSIAHRALDLNDKVIKENAELRQTDAPAAPSAAGAGD